MQAQWKDDQPIYRQLRRQVTTLIMNGTYAEGESLPSVRQVSSDLSINHLTVSKAYQALVDDGLLEKKRGLGMFVVSGAKAMIMAKEKHSFLTTELPEFLIRVTQLDIAEAELIATISRLYQGGK